jgi:uncharacterized protein
MKNYKLPSRQKCLEIIRQCHMPAHILRHSLATEKVAVFLAHKLAEKGIDIDIELVERSALLHDLFRVCDCRLADFSWFDQPVTEQDKQKWKKLKSKFANLYHEDACFEYFKHEYPQLALVIRRHKYIAINDENDKPETWEQKLVYYADKRAMHDKIVTLKQRLEEAHARSAKLRLPGSDSPDIAAIDQLIFELEKEIFSHLDFEPDDLAQQTDYNGAT